MNAWMSHGRGRALVPLRAIAIALLALALVACALMLASCKGPSGGGAAASVSSDSAPSDARPSFAPPPTLIASTNVEAYSYADLQTDIRSLESSYPDLVTVRVLGRTVDGRELYDLVIGDDVAAAKKVLFTAGIHAREYRTPQIVMCQAADLCAALLAGDTYNGRPYSQLMQGVSVHVVPMVNPDGIALAQFGLDGLSTEAAKAAVTGIASLDGTSPTASYWRQWKANANGVDLNRNFDALWSQYEGTGHPSSGRYKGTAPGSEVEAAALIDLTREEGFDCTVSYHSHGEVIYWNFAQQGLLYDRTLSLAQAVQAVTGYALDENYQNLDPAGYKDWAISKMGIPSLTIEVGTGDSPVPLDQLQGILRRNEYVVEQVLCWLEQ